MTNLQVRNSSKASFDVTKRVAPFQERGFAFETFPIGWFQVGWSDEFPIGQAKALSYFGDHQVAFRGESGNLYVFDAFCPHLGGHLGHGGTRSGRLHRVPISWMAIRLVGCKRGDPLLE